MGGTDLAGVQPVEPAELRATRRRMAGFLFALLTAVCWGASPIFIRKGLDGLPSPLWGVTVGLGAAALLYLLWMVAARPPTEMPLARWSRMALPLRLALVFMLLGALGAALGSIARTFAIDLVPVVVAAPLVQTTSLWTLLFAPLLLGRHVERVTPKLLFGAVLVMAGAALVIVGQSA